MKKIGEKLKSLRKKANLNQEQLSSYLGIDQTYLSKIENSEREVTVEILMKLAILYGIKLEDFDNDNVDIQELKLSLRSKDIDGKDLYDISLINEIAHNLEEMNILIKEKK